MGNKTISEDAWNKIQSELDTSRRAAEELKALRSQVLAAKSVNDRTVGMPGAFYGSNSDRKQKNEEARHIMRFLLATRSHDMGTLAALRNEVPDWYESKTSFNEGTAAQGGQLVPEVWDTQIRVVAEKRGFARRLYQNYPMSSHTVHLHRGTTASGAVVAEGVQPTTQTSASFFAATSLTAIRIAAGYIAFEELIEDAPAEFVAYMTRELGRGIAKKEDFLAFAAVTGTDGIDGIATAAGTTVNMAATKTAFSQVSWSDLIDLHAAVKTDVIDNAIYLTCRSVYAALRKEKDTALRPIWNQENPGDIVGHVGLQGLERNTVWTPLGIPMVVVPDDVWLASAASKTAVVFGDFSEYAIFGDRRGISTKVYTEYYDSVALPGGAQGIEISERCGFAYPAPAAFAKLVTAAS
jgi:HK97 family phage major capsid protein